MDDGVFSLILHSFCLDERPFEGFAYLCFHAARVREGFGLDPLQILSVSVVCG